jgi:predicted acylesterase/phospholipase RssA
MAIPIIIDSKSLTQDRKINESSDAPLTVYCMPVSGGRFVAQLALLCELYEAKWISCDRKFDGSKDYQPDLVFAASGGNVASYVALAGDWSPDGINRTALKIESTMFIRPWWPEYMSFMPTWLLAPFKGAIFREGKGNVELFKGLFTPITIQRVEIWTGTYDQTNQRAQFFCNRRLGSTLVDPAYFDDNASLYGCMPLKFLNGDLAKISTASLASASIPVVVSKQHMDGNDYVDGGSMYASPTIVMIPELFRIIKGCGYRSSNTPPKKDMKSQRSLRLTYFCPYEMDVSKLSPDTTSEAGRLVQTLNQFLHASTLQDRASTVDLLYRICGERHTNIVAEHYPKLNVTGLSELMKMLNQQRHYVMFLYPHGSQTINLTSFKPQDIVDKIAEIRKAYGVYVWYFPNGSI